MDYSHSNWFFPGISDASECLFCGEADGDRLEQFTEQTWSFFTDVAAKRNCLKIGKDGNITGLIMNMQLCFYAQKFFHIVFHRIYRAIKEPNTDDCVNEVTSKRCNTRRCEKLSSKKTFNSVLHNHLMELGYFSSSNF